MERYGGFNARDVVLVQRAPHSIDRIYTGRTDRNYLRNQRVIVRRHGVAGINVRVNANAAATWRIIKIDAARSWLEVVGRVFGINTALDRVQPRFRAHDMRRKRLA